MPPLFTRLLAERLNATPASRGRGKSGHAIEPGQILIAPGDFHMKVASGATGLRVFLDQSPPLNSCRPAVDALFTSIGLSLCRRRHCGGAHRHGSGWLARVGSSEGAGASILAQDEASSVVWGMPGAVVNAGLADQCPASRADRAGNHAPGRTGIKALLLCRRADPTPAKQPRARQSIVPAAACLSAGGNRAWMATSTICLRRRLAPIVRQLGLDSIDDLCALLRAGKQEPELGVRWSKP